MKKTIFYILMCLALGMAACFDDDSTLGKDFIPEIEIGELKDTAMVSYSGHVLEVTPEVNTRYTEDQLAYAWYIYNSAGIHHDRRGCRRLSKRKNRRWKNAPV